jgi:hypothetical protein
LLQEGFAATRLHFCEDFNLLWSLRRFAGVSNDFWLQIMVKTWCVCGELRGKRGFLTSTFWGVKNTPRFSILFLMLCLDWESVRPGSGYGTRSVADAKLSWWIAIQVWE